MTHSHNHAPATASAIIASLSPSRLLHPITAPPSLLFSLPAYAYRFLPPPPRLPPRAGAAWRVALLWPDAVAGAGLSGISSIDAVGSEVPPVGWGACPAEDASRPARLCVSKVVSIAQEVLYSTYALPQSMLAMFMFLFIAWRCCLSPAAISGSFSRLAWG